MSNDQTLSENTLFFDSLAQAVFVRFDSRPTLVSVARELFGAAFNSEYPALDIDLADVTLNTPNWITDNKGRRIDGYHRQPLLDVVTQSITGKTPWEDPEEFLLTVRGAHNLFVDMRRIEEFLQVLPQAIVPQLQKRLADYWSQTLLYGGTRGRWLGNVIKYALSIRVMENVASTPLDADQQEMLVQIINCPDKSDRLAVYGAQCTQACLVNYYLQAGSARTAMVSTQMLVIRRVGEREIVLTFSPSGVCKSFASRKEFADREGSRLSDRLLIDAVDLQPFETTGNVFITQAQAILNIQLESLKYLQPIVGQSLQALTARCQQLTDMAPMIVDWNPQGYQQPRFHEVRDNLDDWLKRASGDDTDLYSNHVFEWAMQTLDSGGKRYDHGLVSAEEYARQALQDALVAASARQGTREVLTDLDPDRIMVSQYRSTRSPFEIIDGVTPTQEYAIETLSLTQRALKHLLGLPFILTTTTYSDGTAVPSWMTHDYLRRLIDEVDIGKNYPQRIRRELIDDPVQRASRERLFAQQLRAQLPMLALKLKLKGESGFTRQGYHYVAAVMHPQEQGRYVNGREIVIGPLSFEPDLDSAHSQVEHAFWKPSGEVRNMFLIGPRPDPDIHLPNEPVVLYRPFYEESLIEFPSRYAFMEEVRSNTPRDYIAQADGARKGQSLRDSILDWLEPDARATYVSNGFRDPAARYEIDFLYFFKGTGLWRRKAGHPLLSKTVFEGDPLPHLYEANAGIVIRSADEKTVSGDEFRWERFNTARWALANALFPFVEGPWAVVGGMVTLAESLKEIVKTEQTDDHLPAKSLLVQLLINLGAVLLTHGLNAFGSRSISRIDELHLLSPDLPRTGPGARGELAVSGRLLNPGQGSQLLENRAMLVDFSTSMSGDAQAWLERLGKNVLNDTGPGRITPLPGIRVVDGRWYARVPARLRGQGWAEVSPAQGDNVYLLDNQGQPIPWLQLKNNGDALWEVAPEFRVRGGGPKRTALAKLAEEKAARARARDEQLQVLSLQMPLLESKVNEGRSFIEVAIENRKPMFKAIDELVAKIHDATQEERPRLLELMKKIQQPRMHAADLTVEKAVLDFAQLQQDWIECGRKMTDLYLQDPAFYSKEIVHNLKEMARTQENIYTRLQGLILEHAELGLAGRELFSVWDVEPLADEWVTAEAFVKEQRRLLDGQARIIEAGDALDSTLRELEGFSASQGKAQRKELTAGDDALSHWRFKELEGLKRAISGRSTAPQTVVQSGARDVIRQINLGAVANAQWEVLEYEGYGAGERMAVLDSALSQYDMALSMGKLLEDTQNPPVPQDFLQRFLGRVEALRSRAQDELSRLILEHDLPQVQAPSEMPLASGKKTAVKNSPKKTSKRVFSNRNKETLVGDISEQTASGLAQISLSDPLDEQPITYSKVQDQEVYQRPEIKQPVVSLKGLMAKAKRYLEGMDSYIDWVKKPTNTTPEPTSLQELLESRAKEMEGTASEISRSLQQLAQEKREPAMVEVQNQLIAQSQKLREEGRLLRIQLSRELPPSAGRFQYLLEQGEVSLAAPDWTDKSTPSKAEFLLEYAILDEKSVNVNGRKNVLWYAHFHCPAQSNRYIDKGHLKLEALRFKTYQDQLREARNAAQVRAVRAGDISQQFANRYFFHTAD